MKKRNKNIAEILRDIEIMFFDNGFIKDWSPDKQPLRWLFVEAAPKRLPLPFKTFSRPSLNSTINKYC